MNSKFVLAIRFCLAEMAILVGKWPMADCYFKLCVYVCACVHVCLCVCVVMVQYRGNITLNSNLHAQHSELHYSQATIKG